MQMQFLKVGFMLVLLEGLLVIIGGGEVAVAQARAAQAGVNSRNSSQVEVHVRVVKAESSDPAAALQVDSRIGDLQPQLERLPFRQFSYLSAEKVVMAIKKRQTVTLASGQTLTLRPVYCEEEKIGLWLRWSEKNGDEILDTRLHLNPGESMIAGTDSAPGNGLILAIDVKPVVTEQAAQVVH